MSFFEYTSVMVAVILALGIARILGAVGELLVERRSTRTYWVHGLWLVFYFLLHVRIWWSYWDIRDTPPTLLPAFIFMLLGPALAYLGVYVLIPGSFPDDADAHFYAVRKPFFGIGLVTTVVTVARMRQAMPFIRLRDFDSSAGGCWVFGGESTVGDDDSY